MKASASRLARAISILPFLLVPLISSSAAAKKPDFSEFAGRFRGDVVVRSTSVAVGDTRITATAPQRGKSLRLRVLGVLAGGGSSLGYAGRLHFKSNRRYRVDSADFNLSGNVGPLRGRYKARNRRLLYRGSAALSWGEQLLIDGRIVFGRNGRSIRMMHRITFPEQGNLTWTFQFTANRTGQR